MITSLRLGNFKAIGKTQELPFRPLTLLYGPNSSGKSSMLHGLLFGCHATQTGNLDAHQTDLGGDVVDLGGFRRFVYRRQPATQVEWGATVSAAKIGGAFSALRPQANISITCLFGLPMGEGIHEMPLFQGGIPTDRRPIDRQPRGRPRVQRVEILIDGEPLIRMSGAAFSDQLRVDFLNIPPQLIDSFLASVAFGPNSTVESRRRSALQHLDDALPQMACRVDSLVHIETTWDFVLSSPSVDRSRQSPEDSHAQQQLGVLLSELGRTITRALRKVRYLGPLRSYPARFSIFSGGEDAPWSSSGLHAWSLVRDNDTVRSAVNEWLRRDRLDTSYELAVRQLIPLETVKAEVNRALDDVFSTTDDPEALTAEIGDRLDGLSTGALRELVLLDQRSNTAVSHRDVGLGISQVLPVLVSAYGSQDSMVCIEQPELHLHPKLQADLGDVFIECALGDQKNTFILETHSEHLMLRILRRIRETSDGELRDGLTPVRPSDVAVIYAQPSSEGTQLIQIPVRDDGEFAQTWPKGFFPERSEELF